jgi:hypothetical protein
MKVVGVFVHFSCITSDYQENFWNWQFGDQAFGRSFICLDDGTIVGHVGANFLEGIYGLLMCILMKHAEVKSVLETHSLARKLLSTSNNSGKQKQV